MQIAAQTFSGERLLHDSTVEVVFLEVQNISPRLKKRPEKFLTLLREDVIIVREHFLRSLRA